MSSIRVCGITYSHHIRIEIKKDKALNKSNDLRDIHLRTQHLCFRFFFLNIFWSSNDKSCIIILILAHTTAVDAILNVGVASRKQIENCGNNNWRQY